jgi:DNA/RNA-binding domain of Phe-tRNA-synthetase-like protein
MSEIFVVTDEWRRAHPGAAVGVLALREASNTSDPAARAPLDARADAVERTLRADLAGKSRAEIAARPPLPAYTAYYRRFGNTYHVQAQIESIALKGRSIPRVGALVEAMFIAELELGLLTAGHDLDALMLPARLSSATGSETFTTMSGKEATLKAGDMFIADGEGIMSDIIYGPDGRTRIAPETTAALYTVYGPPGVGAAAVEAHLRAIEANVRLVSPGARLVALEVFTAP